MQLITEYLEGTTESILIEENGKKNMYIEGIFMQSAVKNRNGRIYPTKILESAVNKYIEESVNTNTALGELNHATDPNPDPANASHRIVELHKDGNDFFGKALILNTPKGNIVRGLIEGDTRLGVSSRGLGTTKVVNGINEVQDNYILKCVDIVANPSAPDAFVNGIMEGVNFGLDGHVIGHIKERIKKTTRLNLNAEKIKIFKDVMLKLGGNSR